MNQYVEHIKEVENLNLDTAKFAQIIRNAEWADTTIWEENELPRALLVTRRDEVVSKKYALKKLEIIDAKEIRFYKKQIRKFNAAEINDRNLYYFSRPVFDNSKSLAIIQWDNAHSYLGGGGGIILFQLQSDKTWKKLGNILDWRY
jgi:hypothetical protein